MKLLDGNVLYPEMALIDETVDTIQTELAVSKSAIMDVIELEDALEGQAGEALRNFYQSVHIPFLTKMEETLLRYQEAMNETKDNFLRFDAVESVYIHQDLLEGEVVKGLDQALEITDGLVTEANGIMSSVSDIIPLSPLSMEKFAEHVMKAKSYIYDTVLGNLYDLDASRKSALIDIHENFERIHTYLSSVDIAFKDKAAIEKFNPVSAFMLPKLGQFQQNKEYISEKTLACLAPEEANISQSRVKNIFDTGFGIVLGIKDYGVDLLHGIDLLIRAQSNPMVFANEMMPIVQTVALDPKGTFNNIIQSIKDSYTESITNGDYTSRARYSTYMSLSVTDIFLGTHGAGAATLSASTLGDIGKLSKINKVPSPTLKNSIAQTQKWQSILGDASFGGGNVLNKSKMQQDFLKPTQLMTQERFFTKTNYAVSYSGESAGILLGADKLKDGSKVSVKGIGNSKWKSVELLDELANSGVKYNPNEVIAITKTASGKLAWLERGNSNAGFEHVMRHADEFAAKGIKSNEIPDLLMEALSKGKVVGTQGRGNGRPIYEVVFNGQKQRVAITVGNNGFIVGVNPRSLP